MEELILVNREKMLNRDFEPMHLVELDNPFYCASYGELPLMIQKESRDAFLEMQQAGILAGYMIYVDSGYRPYWYQENILKAMVQDMGEEAFRKVALPGASEHQLGIAIDIGAVIDGKYYDELSDEMEVTKWLQANAYKFGFILRYPKGKEDITGFSYEPWHFRYVGKDISYYLWDNNVCLEEYKLVRK